MSFWKRKNTVNIVAANLSPMAAAATKNVSLMSVKRKLRTKEQQRMSDLLIEGSHTLISLAIGGLAGYCVAYVTGLKAVRKGMQLILRASLNDMYCRFQSAPPTVEEKLIWQEMYGVYERLAENGVMQAKHEDVLHMSERR